MSDFYKTKHIHKNTPRRLVTEFHRCEWNMRQLSKVLDVNILYVSQLIRHGMEPTDKTEKGRSVRVKLFLPRWKPKPHKVREWLPGERDAKKKIAGLARNTRVEMRERGIKF